MSTQEKSWVPAFFFWLSVAVCAVIVIALWPDRAYYFLPMAERPLHPHHAFLRSSGPWGLSFGMIGTLLMFLNLSYLIRKRFLNIQWLARPQLMITTALATTERRGPGGADAPAPLATSAHHQPLALGLGMVSP
jgi:hypothetical protein